MENCQDSERLNECDILNIRRLTPYFEKTVMKKSLKDIQDKTLSHTFTGGMWLLDMFTKLRACLQPTTTKGRVNILSYNDNAVDAHGRGRSKMCLP